jgi:MFS transporter, PAT family, beta-lactamase induction signal transducer AmpG
MARSNMNSAHRLKHFFNPSIWVMIFLGFSSGLPLSLTGPTLQAWFTVAGVPVVAIGMLGLVGQPYIYKFLWAPLMDRFIPPYGGRRRGWMLITQSALIISLVAMGFLSPKTEPLLMSALALLIAFFSASQDISIDAYRTDLLAPSERGFGTALYSAGYRIAMLVSGGIALVLADHLGWKMTYFIMASLMLIGMITSWNSPEPVYEASPPQRLLSATVEPLREFLQRHRALWIIVFIFLYKLCDAFITNMLNPFLLRGAGFSLTDVGLATKTLGISATIAGTFIAGFFLERGNLFRCLLIFGGLQAMSGLLFAALSLAGKDYPLMIVSIFWESLNNGMCTVALLAFLMGLCNHHYTATQFALFSAIAAIPRVFISSVAGVIVEQVGWTVFFVGTSAIAIPGLLVLLGLQKQVNDTVKMTAIGKNQL